MSNRYSQQERLVARALGATPRLKDLAKKGYLRLVYLRHKKTNAYATRYSFQMIGEAVSESFFGYYDKSPSSLAGSHIIFQETNDDTTKASRGLRSVNVVLFNTALGEVVASFPSRAYNWQQGTKLQWITEDRFIFNAYDEENDAYVARIGCASNGDIVRTLPAPIYDCFGGRFSLTLSFDRLARLAPDYGYFCRTNRPFDVDAVEADGVWSVDLDTGEIGLVLSLAQLTRLEQPESMVGAKHSVNHIMIAPDGERFMVIHRWYRGGRRYDRLILAGVDGSNATVLADQGMVSHCFWATESEILAYLRGPDGRDDYWLLDADSGDFRKMDYPRLRGFGDGHPHVVGDWFVTDTYPDKARMQHLFLGNWRTGELWELGEFFHGFEFEGECRCDLHPRLSPDGRSVFFDSVFSGKRRLYRMDFE